MNAKGESQVIPSSRLDCVTFLIVEAEEGGYFKQGKASGELSETKKRNLRGWECAHRRHFHLHEMTENPNVAAAYAEQSFNMHQMATELSNEKAAMARMVMAIKEMFKVFDGNWENMSI